MGIFDIFKKKQKSTDFKCPTCGEIHEGMPALGFSSPYHYNTLNEKDQSEIAELTDDFCVITHEYAH
jgi:hypothetical protein